MNEVPPEITPGYQQVILKDPLSETTRKERRYLLASSVLGIIMVKTGLIPNKIAAFDIEFSASDKTAILVSLAAITTYFLITFIFYALSDYWSYRVDTFLAGARHQFAQIERLDRIVTSLKDQIDLRRTWIKEMEGVNESFREINSQLKDRQGERKASIDSMRTTIKGIEAGGSKLTDQKNEELQGRVRDLRSGLDDFIAESDKSSAKSETLLEQLDLFDQKDLVTNAQTSFARKADKFVKSAQAIASLRLVLEFVVPLIISSYALITLFIHR